MNKNWIIKNLLEWKLFFFQRQVITFIIIIIVFLMIALPYLREKEYLLLKFGVCTNGHITSIFTSRSQNMVSFTFYVLDKKQQGVVSQDSVISFYGDSSLYVGKKVRVKYVPENPNNNTLVSWEEPCKCDSLNQ